MRLFDLERRGRDARFDDAVVLGFDVPFTARPLPPLRRTYVSTSESSESPSLLLVRSSRDESPVVWSPSSWLIEVFRPSLLPFSFACIRWLNVSSVGSQNTNGFPCY